MIQLDNNFFSLNVKMLVMDNIIFFMRYAMNANLIVNIQNMIQANQHGQSRGFVTPKIRKYLENVKTNIFTIS